MDWSQESTRTSIRTTAHLSLERGVTPELVVELAAPGLDPAEEARLVEVRQVLVVPRNAGAKKFEEEHPVCPNVRRLFQRRKERSIENETQGRRR